MTVSLPDGHALLHHNIAGSIATCQVDSAAIGSNVVHTADPQLAAAVTHLLYADGQCYVYGVCAPHIAESIQFQADETRGEGRLEGIFVLFTPTSPAEASGPTS